VAPAAGAAPEAPAAARRDAAREALARAERRLRSGDADRPELLAARAAETEAQLDWIDARAARWAAAERLEDVVQRPLDAVRTEFAAGRSAGVGAEPPAAPSGSPATPRATPVTASAAAEAARAVPTSRTRRTDPPPASGASDTAALRPGTFEGAAGRPASPRPGRADAPTSPAARFAAR
jgi:hypothetical protein